MSTLYKMEEWQSSTGLFHCNCVNSIKNDGGNWLHPARILGLSPAEYVKWVVTNFNPIVSHDDECNYVFFCWKEQKDMRKFKNYINKKAREIDYRV